MIEEEPDEWDVVGTHCTYECITIIRINIRSGDRTRYFVLEPFESAWPSVTWGWE